MWRRDGFARKPAHLLHAGLPVEGADNLWPAKRFRPAIAVVHRLQSEFPHLDLRLVVDDRRHGSNRKVSSLINMARFIEHEIVVLADSDVGVDPDFLQRLCGALERPGVGLVSCLYRGKDTGTLWSRLACMGMEFQFLPSVVFGVATGLAKPCLGPTMALQARNAGCGRRVRNSRRSARRRLRAGRCG